VATLRNPARGYRLNRRRPRWQPRWLRTNRRDAERVDEYFVDRRRLRADRLVHLGMRGESSGGQRGDLVRRCGQPVVGAAAATFCVARVKPMPCKFSAAAVKSAGCALTNDIWHSLHTSSHP
jgi:hypothetical protein